MNEIVLRQIEHHMMAASDSHGHSVVLGRAPSTQDWVGVKASDLLLVAVAACATYDVIEILNKQREVYSNLVVTCQGDQLADPPYTFTRIHLHFELRGSLSPEKLERAIQLSIEKYCSVISTLRPDTPVTSDYTILE